MKKLLLIVFFFVIYQSGFSQINNGLVAIFDFNNTYNDETNSIIGTANGSPTFTTDRNSNDLSAINLNGTTDYISFYDPNVKANLPVTISAWVKVNSYPEAQRIFFSDSDYDNNSGYWFSIRTNTGQLSLGMAGSIGGVGSHTRRSYSTDSSITLGEWHHVIGIIRAYNDMSIYIDCIEQPGFYDGTGPTTMVYTNTNSLIGRAPANPSKPNGWYFDGALDDVAIWNRSLDSSEILDLCNGALFCNSKSFVSSSICMGDSLLAGGNYQFNSGLYYDTLTNINGCDSIIETNLLVLNPDTTYLSLFICDGDSTYLGGAYRSVEGTYFDTYNNLSGCDSIVSTTLSIIAPDSVNIDMSICPGDSLFIGGSFQNVAGVYYDSYSNINGCDSVQVTNLSIVNNNSSSISGSIFFENSPISAGEVRLLSKTGNGPQSIFDLDSTFVDANGTYYFNNVSPGNYLLKALGDTSIYQNVATYGDSTNHWQMATEYYVSGTCQDSLLLADIYLIDFPVNIGFGNINGSVTNGGNKMTGDYIGANITLENELTGEVVQGAFVDSLDRFRFNSVEIGSYLIHLDLPGYTNDSITSIDFTQANQTFEVNLTVDDSTSTIDVFSVQETTSINELEINDLITIYPNPVNHFCTIDFKKPEDNVSISIYNIEGKMLLNTAYKQINNLNIDFSDYSAGLYHLMISTDSIKKSVKIVIE